jgi:hypothetical protein
MFRFAAQQVRLYLSNNLTYTILSLRQLWYQFLNCAYYCAFLAHAVNFPCGRKPEKTHDSFHIEPTSCEVKGAYVVLTLYTLMSVI